MRGRAADVPLSRKVSDNGDELGAQDRAEARQGLDDLGTLVEADRLADLPVVVLDPLVQDKQLVSQVACQPCRLGLAGKSGRLAPGGLNRPGCGSACAVDPTALQPCSEP